MPSKSQLLHVLDELDALLELSRALDPDMKREILALRRRITEQKNNVLSMSALTFDTLGEREDCRRELARYRSSIAAHFGTWPIVAIDRNDQDYSASVARFRESHRCFSEWARTALSRHPD